MLATLFGGQFLVFAVCLPQLQIKLNTELLKKVVRNRDQETLRLFQGRSLQPPSIFEVNEETGEVSEIAQNYADSKFAEVVASIEQPEGDFDFDLNMSKEDFGAESKKLRYTGAGKYAGTGFEFSGSIEHIKLQYHLGTKFNKELEYDAQTFIQDPFVIDI